MTRARFRSVILAPSQRFTATVRLQRGQVVADAGNPLDEVLASRLPPGLHTAGAVFCEVQARSYGRLGAVVVASHNASREGRRPSLTATSRAALRGVRPELG